MTDDPKLKPCPMCGNMPKLEIVKWIGGNVYCAHCDDESNENHFDKHSIAVSHARKEIAIDIWNRLVASAAPQWKDRGSNKKE